MALNIPDPATYVVPDNQALLYSETIEGVTTYKYKLSVGSSGAINLSILSALSLKPADLPCLVFTADLLRCLNSNFASIADLAISLASRASIDFVKQLAALKVNKSQYLETLETLATKEEMTLALLSKASALDTASALNLKANKSDVFTIGQVIDLLESYIGAKTVADLAARDALQPGIHRFIWVSDPAGDPDILDATLPALYMWQVENGVGAYVYLASAGQGFNQGSVDAILEVLGTGFSKQSTVSMQLSAVKTSADNALSFIGTGFSAEDNIFVVVSAISASLASISTTVSSHTGSISTIVSQIGTGFTDESTVSVQLAAVKSTADLAYNATGIITSIIGDGFSGGNTIAYNVGLAKTAANNAITLIGSGFTSESTISTQLAAVKSNADTAISLIGTGFSAENTVSLRISTVESTVATLVPGFKGYYVTVAALNTAFPTGSDGFHAIVAETGTFWAWLNGAWTNTSVASSEVTWSSLTGKPSAIVLQKDATVDSNGTITLADETAVADLPVGSHIKITANNSTYGITAGDVWVKTKQSHHINPDPTRINVSGEMVQIPYIFFNPYTLQGGTGSSRNWLSSNSTFTTDYYNGSWRVYWNGITFATAVDDGSHDPWDPSLTWISNESYVRNLSVTEYSDTVTNHIEQFVPVGKEATTTRAGLFSVADKTKLDGLGSSVAPGTIMDFSGAVENIPSGFFLCNAADVSRTTYANLFVVIGEKFGFGDGSTTFTLPKIYPSFKNQVAWDPDSRESMQCAKLGNDIFYCTGKGTLGDVYKQTNATGAFVALGLANENWKGIVAHGSDLYVCSDSYNSSSGQIYKQTGGSGEFVSLAQESRRWTGMYSVGEDVYCGTVNGSLYKQTGGVGDFAEFIPTISTVTFNGLASFNGDMYACGTSYNSTADIYKQTGGVGSFVPLGTSKNWSALFVCEDCLYAIEEVTGNLYRRTSESPAFVLCDYGFGIPGRSIFDSSANCFYSANGAYGLQRSNKILKLIKY